MYESQAAANGGTPIMKTVPGLNVEAYSFATETAAVAFTNAIGASANWAFQQNDDGTGTVGNNRSDVLTDVLCFI